MLRHAYLIMAFNNFGLLDRFIELLDCPNNDFYIHVDKKQQVDLGTILKYKTKNAAVYFTDRISVNWGSISELKGNIILMETAHQNGPYDYYHFVQGADMPIKPLAYINDFFERNNGKEFLNINPEWSELGEYRMLYHHYFMDMKCYRGNRILNILRVGIARLERLLGLKRGREKVYVGSALWTLTNESITYLLERKKYILKRGKNTFVPVEMIWHTILMQNERFVKALYKYSEEGDNLYLIDWNRQSGKFSPHLYTIEDYEMLMNSEQDMLYARKFNEGTDSVIIDKIYGALREANQLME